MATNTSSNSKLAQLIPIYYERRMLERLKPQLLFHQFGEKKALPKNEGASVYWHRWNSTKMGRLISESGAGAGQGLSATRVSAALYMVGHHAVVTTYIDMVSINSVVQGAIDLFADSSAVTLDFMTSRLLLWRRASASAQFQVSAAGGYLGDRPGCLSAGTYSKCLSASSWQAPVWSINDFSTRSKAISALYGGNSATAWTPNIFRTIALKLKVKNALRFEDGYYKAIMHPDVVNQLRGSSAFIDLHKYVETGAETFAKGTLRQGGERGLAGVIEGFKIYESTEAPLFTTSGAFGGTANGTRAQCSAYGGGRLYFNFFFGKNAYGVTDFDGGIRTFIKTPGPGDTSNPLNLYSTIGYRLIYTAKVLNNSACLWVVNGRPTTVGA
jgi:N4-gp56 family major capsid protein